MYKELDFLFPLIFCKKDGCDDISRSSRESTVVNSTSCPLCQTNIFFMFIRLTLKSLYLNILKSLES